MEQESLMNEYARLRYNLIELADYFLQKGDYELSDKMIEEYHKLRQAYKEQKQREWE